MVKPDNCRETEVVQWYISDLGGLSNVVKPDNCKETEVVLQYISHWGGLNDVIDGGTR